MARRRQKKRSLITWLLLLVAVVIVLNLSKNFLIKTAIEHAAIRTTGLSVDIQDLNLSLLSGQLAIKGLIVGNPPGFQLPQMARVAELEARVQVSSLMQKTLVIDFVRINGMTLYYEIGKQGNNLYALFKKLEADEKAIEAGKPPKDTPKGGGRKFIIRELSIVNASVEPNVAIGGQMLGKRVELADIHLADIGKEGRTITSNELAQIIVGSLIKSATLKLPGSILKDSFDGISKGLKDLGQGLFGK